LEPTDVIDGTPDVNKPVTENQIRVYPPARELQLIDLSKRFLAAAHYWSLPAQFVGAKVNKFPNLLNKLTQFFCFKIFWFCYLYLWFYNVCLVVDRPGSIPRRVIPKDLKSWLPFLTFSVKRIAWILKVSNFACLWILAQGLKGHLYL